MSTSSALSPRSPKAPRRKGRRAFGTVRQLQSGRWQARWEDKYGRTHAGPHTCASERAADDWLSTVRADLLRGVWRSPDLGSDTLTGYMRAWIDQRTDLAVSTRAGYEITLRRWIDRDLHLPGIRGGKPARINIGAQPLNSLTPTLVREWYAAAHATQVRERAERGARGAASRASRSKTSHVRAWARSQGWAVSDTGRLSREVLTAWTRAGRPGDPDLENPAPLDASSVRPAAVVVQALRYLRACLNAALTDGLITANPCRVKRRRHFHDTGATPREPGRGPAPRSRDAPRFSEAVDLAAWSALRAGKLFALAPPRPVSPPADLDAPPIRPALPGMPKRPTAVQTNVRHGLDRDLVRSAIPPSKAPAHSVEPSAVPPNIPKDLALQAHRCPRLGPSEEAA